VVTVEARAEVMTDYQLKVILNLVLQVVEEGFESKKSPEQIIRSIEAIRDGNRNDSQAREAKK